MEDRDDDSESPVSGVLPGFSEELAEPLFLLLASLRLTLRELEGADRAAPEHALVRASRSVHRALDCAVHLSELVHERHLHERKRARGAEFVELRSVLHAATTMVEPHVERRARLFRRFDVAPVLVANPSRLLQAFVVLLSRASELLPEGEPGLHRITVALAAHASDEARVTVTISAVRLVAPRGSRGEDGAETKIVDPLRLVVAIRFLELEGGEVEVRSHGAEDTVRVHLSAAVPDYDA